MPDPRQKWNRSDDDSEDDSDEDDGHEDGSEEELCPKSPHLCAQASKEKKKSKIEVCSCSKNTSLEHYHSLQVKVLL